MTERMKMVRVRAHAPFRLDKWAEGYFGFMPLPELKEDGFLVGVLDEEGRVPTEELSQGARICCLSDRGMMLLQQRMVHASTRVVVDLAAFHERSAAVLFEAEMLEEWCEALVGRMDDEDQRAARLTEEAEQFDSLLGATRSGSDGQQYSYRDLIQELDQRSTVRRLILSEIEERIA